jgi:hypothetical protein
MELALDLVRRQRVRPSALIVGMLGPLLQSFGVVWDLVSHALEDGEDAHEITLNHVLFAPEHLVIAAGFMVSLVCIPLAIQMAHSSTSRDEEAEL